MRALLVTLALATFACATETDITGAWRDPMYRGGPMRSVVVFGAGMSETERRTVEDMLARELFERGVRAQGLFPHALPEREDMRTALERGRWDGALMTTLRGVHERTSYIPNGGAGFYNYYYSYAWGYSYPVTDEYVKFETTLWDRRGELVWSATTQTVNPSSQRDFARSLSDTVVDELAEVGLVTGARD